MQLPNYNIRNFIILLLTSIIAIKLQSQNVGINANDPQEKLHMRTNGSKIAVRLDNKKSVESGLNYGTVIGTPVAVQNSVVGPAPLWVDWTDLDHTKLINSDNNRLSSPALNIFPERANTLRVLFHFAPTIPSTAQITDIKLHIEWQRTGTFAGNMGVSFWLLKASNLFTVARMGGALISSSTDEIVTNPIKKVFGPITADMINLDDIVLSIYSLASYINGTSGLLIDQLWLEVEYAVPADGTEDVSWTAGAEDGTFVISNSDDLLTDQFLTIDETGTTILNGLKITQSAGDGKVLTSNDDGKASWEDLPIEDQVWLNVNDTAYYASGPTQINNAIGDAAVIFDKGESRLNNGINMIDTDNQILNTILDADGNQNNEEWNIYKNDDVSSGQHPTVHFHLDGADSWINGGGNFGVGRIDPDHPLHIGTDATNGNGAHVTTGGTWTNGSSIRFKDNFQSIDPQEILEKLASLNILEWEYKGSEEGKHLGPVAEEFYEAFGLGGNEQYISTVDADGISMVAIQALYINLKEKDKIISKLESDIQNLQNQLGSFQAFKEELDIIKRTLTEIKK